MNKKEDKRGYRTASEYAAAAAARIQGKTNVSQLKVFSKFGFTFKFLLPVFD